MKTDKQDKNIDLKYLHGQIRQIKKQLEEFSDNIQDQGCELDTLLYKLRRDVPIRFISTSGIELFKTFNLKHIPNKGEKIILVPTPESCCLNSFTMKELNFSEEELANHILENNIKLSFFVKDVLTEMTVLDSHPTNEWEDNNGINFENEDEKEVEYNTCYIVILDWDNTTRKQIMIEKI